MQTYSCVPTLLPYKIISLLLNHYSFSFRFIPTLPSSPPYTTPPPSQQTIGITFDVPYTTYTVTANFPPIQCS